MRLPRAHAPCLSPLRMSLYARSGRLPQHSESRRFESRFAALSRVNNSLIRNNCYPTQNSQRAERANESETRTRRGSKKSLVAQRLGMTDDALHGGERATQ